MQSQFHQLADVLTHELKHGEIFTCWFSGERSDFVRFNHGRIRQAGNVTQRYLRLRLIDRGRQASLTFSLSGDGDLTLAHSALAELRSTLADLAADPYLLYATDVRSSQNKRSGTLPSPEDCVEQIVAAARGQDLVGIYAAGTIYRGFANSLGQRNWHEVENFNFEWSLYHQADKAVKTGYAGFDWQPEMLPKKMRAAATQLELLQGQARTLTPGEYRAFLAPRAVEELVGMLAWGGLSAKARRTKQSPLIRMEQGAALSPQVTLRENTAAGTAPAFQGDGFAKPEAITMIDRGQLADPLIGPRTAKEYGLTSNGANAGESPESIEMSPGALMMADALDSLDTGLMINNLWYLNYSDRPACRLTGMTRFATFWVENGKIVAPVNVMRFDDTLYRILGDNLGALTQEQDFMLDSSSYGERSTQSSRLPGALVTGLKFTL